MLKNVLKTKLAKLLSEYHSNNRAKDYNRLIIQLIHFKENDMLILAKTCVGIPDTF